MGLLSSLILLPLRGPMDGALWVARQILDAADSERNNPATLRALLETLEAQLLSGEITEEDYEVMEIEILERLQAIR